MNEITSLRTAFLLYSFFYDYERFAMLYYVIIQARNKDFAKGEQTLKFFCLKSDSIGHRELNHQVQLRRIIDEVWRR